MTKNTNQRDRARELRKNATPAERILWSKLRGRRLAEFKFRRQVPIGPFFADFACIACKVIVEVDGDIHESREEHDLARTAFLTKEGWAVLRFWNAMIYDETEAVLTAIENLCRERASGDR